MARWLQNKDWAFAFHTAVQQALQMQQKNRMKCWDTCTYYEQCKSMFQLKCKTDFLSLIAKLRDG